MAENNDIISLIQKVIQQYLKTKTLGDIPTANVFRGIAQGALTDDDQSLLPCVVVQCDSAAHQAPYTSGNWTCEVEIEIKSHAADSTEDEHHTRTGAVFDLFMDTGITAGLNTVPIPFHAFQVRVISQSYSLTSSGIWRSALRVEVDACASSIS